MSVPGWPIGLIFFLVIGLSIEHLFEHIHHYHQSLSSWSKWSDFVFFCLKTSFFSIYFPSCSVPMGHIDLIPLLGDRSWPWLSAYEVSSIFVPWFGHNYFDKCTWGKKRRFLLCFCSFTRSLWVRLG